MCLCVIKVSLMHRGYGASHSCHVKLQHLRRAKRGRCRRSLRCRERTTNANTRAPTPSRVSVW